jgi:hypothetical protein
MESEIEKKMGGVLYYIIVLEFCRQQSHSIPTEIVFTDLDSLPETPTQLQVRS